MSKDKVYETLYKAMGECWEWAYDKPENAVAYFDGLWTMADRVANLIGNENAVMYTGLENCKLDDMSVFNQLGKEAST